MNLGQMLLVLVALVVLGALILQSNSIILSSSEALTSSEIDASAISLATSVMEEASGKLFDEVINDTAVLALTDPSQLSATLGPEGDERFRDTTGTHPLFNDFDDFNGLFVVFKGTNPEDAAPTPGADWEFAIPDLRGKFYVHVSVEYVQPPNLDMPAAGRTWHKKMVLTVTSPSSAGTVVLPWVMSYWD
jgi:hypothetical protein